MKILMLNTYDIVGGAARAVYRIHTGLKIRGIDSQLMVQIKKSSDDSIIGPSLEIINKIKSILSSLDYLPFVLYPYRKGYPWGIGWLNNFITHQVKKQHPDLIHLHWVSRGFVPITSLSEMKVPLVWTLHDSWPFTGGCHLPQDCLRYQDRCGLCPQLSSKRENDLSRWIWNRKNKYWKETNLTVVSPRTWLAECAQSSSLFRHRRIEIVHHGLNTELYKPINKQHARKTFNLPRDKKIILGGAFKVGYWNKGFEFICDAAKRLASAGWKDKVELVIFGAGDSSSPPETGLKTRYVGYIHDEALLAQLYSAADVFIAPSKQEPFGQTVLEAMACGVPCVGFNDGGIRDTIEHQKTGYLAIPFHGEDLTYGISWVLENENRWKTLSLASRERVEQKFRIEDVAYRYIQLYQEIISST